MLLPTYLPAGFCTSVRHTKITICPICVAKKKKKKETILLRNRKTLLLLLLLNGKLGQEMKMMGRGEGALNEHEDAQRM